MFRYMMMVFQNSGQGKRIINVVECVAMFNICKKNSLYV